MRKTPVKVCPDDIEVGVIHGRFQILHHDHLKYLLAGKKQCRALVVGITNPDPMLTRKEDSAPERDLPVSNPLTFYERQFLVRTVLQENGVRSNEFSVVPLPINFPELYQYYVPMEATFFLTIYDDWGKKKQDYFESMGLKTHVLWEVPLEKKGISGSDVRARMMDGKPWKHLVPKSVAALLENWNIPDRMKRLTGKT